jgi:hypothetical protein
MSNLLQSENLLELLYFSMVLRVPHPFEPNQLTTKVKKKVVSKLTK